MKDNWLNTDLCTGCGACADKCPLGCISMIDDNGCLKPDIDIDKCVNCNQCKKVCPNFTPSFNAKPAECTYVAFYKDTKCSIKSSSGGLFVALAKYILAKQGIVYGAAIAYDNQVIECRHIRVEDEKDLYLLQGSKYVQSRMSGIYTQVKKDLTSGKTVLFSGTSCQVASLRNFVGAQERLFTVDLVCHGVPQDKIYNDYIDFIENKYDGCIENIAFRSKETKYRNKLIPYTIQVKIRKKDSTLLSKSFVRPKSSFYRLFSNRAGYRTSCYQCKYSSLVKSSDITLGDFLPRTNEISRYGFNASLHYSSVFVHTNKGKELLDYISDSIWKLELPIEEMLGHHLNMQHPSVITDEGKKYLNIYEKGGFNKLHSYVAYENYRNDILYFIHSVLKRVYSLCK